MGLWRSPQSYPHYPHGVVHKLGITIPCSLHGFFCIRTQIAGPWRTRSCQKKKKDTCQIYFYLIHRNPSYQPNYLQKNTNYSFSAKMIISTRRLRARFSSFELSTSGLYSPKPATVNLEEGKVYASTISRITAIARPVDSSQFVL
ncbi:MAG: hypothetical protein K0R47_4745 [Brevibacillus sp.]|nr:hypothetical protein [Brevibacillus sp.]